MTILNETTLTNGVSIPKPGVGTWLIQRRQEPRMRGFGFRVGGYPEGNRADLRALSEHLVEGSLDGRSSRRLVDIPYLVKDGVHQGPNRLEPVVNGVDVTR